MGYRFVGARLDAPVITPAARVVRPPLRVATGRIDLERRAFLPGAEGDGDPRPSASSTWTCSSACGRAPPCPATR
ncbi:MAG: hypothetical protein R3F59_13415 [Myxococcota bacterium]